MDEKYNPDFHDEKIESYLAVSAAIIWGLVAIGSICFAIYYCFQY